MTPDRLAAVARRVAAVPGGMSKFYVLDLPWHDNPVYVVVEDGEEAAFKAAVEALGPDIRPELESSPVPRHKAYSVREIPELAG